MSLWNKLFGKRDNRKPASSSPTGYVPPADRPDWPRFRVRPEFRFTSEIAALRQPYPRYGSDVRLELKLDDQVFHLREVDGFVCVRPQGVPVSDEALVLPERLQHPINLDKCEADYLAARIRDGLFGRCILVVPTGLSPAHSLLFFFMPDASGSAFLGSQEVKFRWAGESTISADNLTEVDPDELRQLGRKLYVEQVRGSLNPRYEPSGDEPRDEPTTFLCGFEEELRTLTVAILQSDSRLWISSNMLYVGYRGVSPRKRGGFVELLPTDLKLDPTSRRRAHSLCELAFRLNQFTGRKWQRVYTFDNRPLYQEGTARLYVEVAAPSKQERQKAKRRLVKWLTGRIHSPDKLALYGIPEFDAAEETVS